MDGSKKAERPDLDKKTLLERSVAESVGSYLAPVNPAIDLFDFRRTGSRDDLSPKARPRDSFWQPAGSSSPPCHAPHRAPPVTR